MKLQFTLHYPRPSSSSLVPKGGGPAWSQAIIIVSKHTSQLKLVVIAMSFRLDITARVVNYSVATV